MIERDLVDVILSEERAGCLPDGMLWLDFMQHVDFGETNKSAVGYPILREEIIRWCAENISDVKITKVCWEEEYYSSFHSSSDQYDELEFRETFKWCIKFSNDRDLILFKMFWC